MVEDVELLGNKNDTDDRATPLLAVCIPTHNRRIVLEECLASVLPQAGALGVGVIVSDNGSSDGTWQALETLKRQYPWMQIMRHTRDIGPRGNLIGAVLSSRALRLADRRQVGSVTGGVGVRGC
jgi:glycosyltransferase involved in cell wall biosynthesis